MNRTRRHVISLYFTLDRSPEIIMEYCYLLNIWDIDKTLYLDTMQIERSIFSEEFDWVN